MANIVLRLSTGGAGTTNSNPAQALGGEMATNAEAIITTSNTTINNLFDNITKAENFAGTTDYRCVFIHNNTAVAGEIFANGVVYISGSPLATFQVGVGAKNLAAVTIANELTAPSGITFTSPTLASPRVLLASNNILNPGDYISIWLKRTANNINGSGTVTDSLPLVVKGTE